VKVLSRVVPAVASALAVAAFAAPAASASTTGQRDFGHGREAVFVQTDNTAGNAVVVYDRAPDGTLTIAGTYPTGGLGGVLTGSVVDHLASQGSLVYDRDHGLLYAVNAGSDTVSVFAVYGDRLALRQVLSSGGTFPVSLTVHGDHVYVLNALGAGSVYGYRVDGGQLSPIPGSSRSLGLTPVTGPNQFTNTPGQVAFTPDGSALLVTTKMNGNDIDVFSVGHGGLLSASPTVNSEPGTVPFAISFSRGDVLIAEAGPNALATFSLSDGVLTQLDVALTGQAATCWVARAGRYFYVSNAGSGSVSGYKAGDDGSLTALGNTATDAGTVDATSAAHGQFLYVQTGKNGIVDEYAVGFGGSLTPIGSVTVAGAAGGEGIASS
jgi:6-phosphogluconolactonase (cycloisomerase 2 family)